MYIGSSEQHRTFNHIYIDRRFEWWILGRTLLTISRIYNITILLCNIASGSACHTYDHHCYINPRFSKTVYIDTRRRNVHYTRTRVSLTIINNYIAMGVFCFSNGSKRPITYAIFSIVRRFIFFLQDSVIDDYYIILYCYLVT